MACIRNSACVARRSVRVWRQCLKTRWPVCNDVASGDSSVIDMGFSTAQLVSLKSSKSG